MFDKRDYNATIIKILFCVVCHHPVHFRRKTQTQLNNNTNSLIQI